MRSVHLGDEEPYLTEKDAPPLPTMPEDVQNKVDARRRQIATQRAKAAAEEASKEGTYYDSNCCLCLHVRSSSLSRTHHHSPPQKRLRWHQKLLCLLGMG